MAAPKNNQNAVGNSGGKSRNDRELAARVRSLALTEIEKYLKGTDAGYQDKEMRHALILKLAPSLLPRLNEHSGEEGGPMQISVTNYGTNRTLPVSTSPVPITVITGD